jgi:hypothetical protein
MSGYSQQELEEMAAEFAAMDAEFAEMGLEEMDSELSEAFAELDTELEAAGLGSLGFEAGSLSELADNDFDEAFIGKFLRNKAKKLIANIVRLVRQYGDCAKCVPKVVEAVAYFKTKQYASAIRAAYDAYLCIRSCTRN